MMINIAKFSCVEEFISEFSGCEVSLTTGYKIPIKYVTANEFDNRHIDGVFDPWYLQWYSVDQVSSQVAE